VRPFPTDYLPGCHVAELVLKGMFVMMKKMICLTVVTALLVIGVAVSQEAQEKKPMADRHKDRGVTCGACHDGESEPKAASSKEYCLTCKNHGSWDTVDARIKENKEYKFNPHRNHITESNKLDCTMCHKAHTTDTIICLNCHTAMKFK